MPKPAHLRITFGGVFGSPAAPVEQWQTSVLFANPVGATGDRTKVELEAALPNISAQFFLQVMPLLDGGVTYEYVDIRKILGDGKQPRNVDGSFGSAARFVLPTPKENTGTPRYPYQCATVVTTLSARQGPTGRGRMYLPAPAAALSGDGRLTTAQADAFSTAIKTLLDAINSNLAGEKVCVVSSLGSQSPITGGRTGRAGDTHRSRRADILEQPGVVKVLA